MNNMCLFYNWKVSGLKVFNENDPAKVRVQFKAVSPEPEKTAEGENKVWNSNFFTAFGAQAEIIKKYVKEGQHIAVIQAEQHTYCKQEPDGTRAFKTNYNVQAVTLSFPGTYKKEEGQNTYPAQPNGAPVQQQAPIQQQVNIPMQPQGAPVQQVQMPNNGYAPAPAPQMQNPAPVAYQAQQVSPAPQANNYAAPQYAANNQPVQQPVSYQQPQYQPAPEQIYVNPSYSQPVGDYDSLMSEFA